MKVVLGRVKPREGRLGLVLRLV